MSHSDDNGLVLPPALAPIQVVIIPIYKSEEQLYQITEKVQPLIQKLKAKGISVKYDDDDSKRSGWKFNEYEVKGVPVRIAIGPRDLENNHAEVCRRDTLAKTNMPLDTLDVEVEKLLAEIQQSLFDRTVKFREENTRKADTRDEFVDILDNKAGFVYAHWDGTPETEELIKEKAKATIRCIPFNNPLEEGKCILTGKPSKQRVLFARAY